MKILYITSLSHSGSTLLDVLLNAHPDVISIGEVKQLGRFARFEKPRAPRDPGPQEGQANSCRPSVHLQRRDAVEMPALGQGERAN